MTHKKALVLGGSTGMLGQALIHKLHEKNWHTIPLGRNDGDILNAEFLQEKIIEYAPDVLFNAIAWTQVDLAETHKQQALTVNRGFPALLGSIIKNTQIHIVHFSTDFVFDGTKGTPYTEDDTTNPISVYGSTKLSGEQALLNLKLDRCTIIRTSWLFGPGRKNFIETILSLAQNKNSLPVVIDQIGSPTYTLDLAEATLNLIHNNATGIFHISNAGQASWCELAAEALRQANIPCAVQGILTSEWGKNTAPRPPYSVLCTKKYEQTTGLKMQPWNKALQHYIFTYFLNSELTI